MTPLVWPWKPRRKPCKTGEKYRRINLEIAIVQAQGVTKKCEIARILGVSKPYIFVALKHKRRLSRGKRI